ncbi:MAG: CehA/McbA family metallohydrolase, partial [bacterium]|nr:CehA/McbA family metallohydrolase [bacterium]
DQNTGEPLAGVEVELAIKNREGKWTFLDGFRTDDSGAFDGMVPNLKKKYRLTASLSGRPDPEPVYFRIPASKSLELQIPPGGTLRYEVNDGDGRGLPARIGLYQNDELARTIYCRHGSGQALVVPGAYQVSVTRGFEYTIHEGDLVIEPGRTAKLSATLLHAVDTRGFLSTDTHLHAGPSGDSKVPIPMRIVTAAAEGLEVPVSTDHEAVVPWQPGIEESRLGQWVATVLGEEVTCTSPEHINMYPVKPRFDLDARGGPVRWYGLDIDEVYAAIRERGAGVIQLNHARLNCAYMCAIDYDRATGRANLERPEYVGLKPDAKLWSWNFNAIELQNGNKRVFMDPKNPKSTGTFEDWMSFVNLGHKITAVSVTDTHGLGMPGMPRTYFKSSTDEPAHFNQDELVESILEGRAVTSTGAFARVMINGRAGMGDTEPVDESTVDLMVHVESIPSIDVSHFKVFVNCDQVANVELAPTNDVVNYDGTLNLRIEKDSQIVVMGFGKNFLPRGMPQFDPLGVPRFATNPIYVDYNGDGYTPPGWDGCDYELP